MVTEKIKIEEILSQEQIQELDKLIETHGNEENRLIPMLEKIQILLGYIPVCVQERVSEKTKFLQIIFTGLSLFIHFFQ